MPAQPAAQAREWFQFRPEQCRQFIHRLRSPCRFEFKAGAEDVLDRTIASGSSFASRSRSLLVSLEELRGETFPRSFSRQLSEGRPAREQFPERQSHAENICPLVQRI